MTGDVEISPGIWLRYGCDTSRLSKSLRDRFVPLRFDADTRCFVATSFAEAASPVRTRMFHASRRLLSDYDAYGMLGMYGMYLLSPAHVSALLGSNPSDAPRELLDVGAGNGAVTEVLAPGFARVTTTEASRVLRLRLRQRGYRVLNHDVSLAPLDEHFDLIACLNVLDRCARPRSLLTHLRAMLRPQDRLLLSVPLPLRPHVHVGPRTADPEESLPRANDKWGLDNWRLDDWELDASALVDELLEPMQLTVERFGRLPYLSCGDSQSPIYVLDAAIFVLRAG